MEGVCTYKKTLKEVVLCTVGHKAFELIALVGLLGLFTLHYVLFVAFSGLGYLFVSRFGDNLARVLVTYVGFGWTSKSILRSIAAAKVVAEFVVLS